jgi:hypothetical protein
MLRTIYYFDERILDAIHSIIGDYNAMISKMKTIKNPYYYRGVSRIKLKGIMGFLNRGPAYND